MIFESLPLEGAFLIKDQPKPDERGFFSRIFCSEEFKKRGLQGNFIQANHSQSKKKATLRGLHYQLPPYSEEKLVRCIKGSIYDVILDIRPDSLTFGKSFGAALSPSNNLMMYVPKGFAHGFLTLEEDTEILYLVSMQYSKEKERGIRWNDPAFSIAWPFQPKVVSERDSSHHDFSSDTHLK